MFSRIADAGRVLTGRAKIANNAVVRGRIMAGVGSEAQYKHPDLTKVENQESEYIDSSLVYMAITRIARTVASSDWYVMKLLAPSSSGKTRKQHLANHPIEQLFRTPNAWMSQFELFESIFSYLFLTGNAYLYLASQTEIIPLRPDRVTIVAGPDTQTYIRGYTYRVNNTTIPLFPEDVIHFKFFHPKDDFYGLSPLEPATLAVETDIYMSRFNRGFFGKDHGIPPNIVSVDPMLPDPKFEQLVDDWSTNYGTTNKERKTMFIRGGDISYTDMSKSQREMDFLGARKYSKEEVMLIFGIPPGVLDANATEANAIAGKEVLYSETLWPNMVLCGQKLTSALCPHYGKDIVVEPRDIRIANAMNEFREIEAKSPYFSANELRQEYWDAEPALWDGADLPVVGPSSGGSMRTFFKPNILATASKVQSQNQPQPGAEDQAALEASISSDSQPTKALPIATPDVPRVYRTAPMRQELQQFYRYALKGKPLDKFTFTHCPEGLELSVKALVDTDVLDLLQPRKVLPAAKRVSVSGVPDPNAKEKEATATDLASAFASAFVELQDAIIVGVKHVSANTAQPYLDYFDNKWWKAALAAFIASLWASYYDELEAAARDAADVVAVQTGTGFDDAVIPPLVKDATDNWAANWLTGIIQTTRAAFEALLARWASTGLAKAADLVSAVQESPLFGEDRATLCAETETTGLSGMAAYIGQEVAGGDNQGVTPQEMDEVMHAHPNCVCFVQNGVWMATHDGHQICQQCQARDGKTIRQIVDGGL